MSRLDSFIRRLQAQRACLDHAVQLVGAEAGTVAMLREDSAEPPDLVFNHTCGRAAEELNGICLK